MTLSEQLSFKYMDFEGKTIRQIQAETYGALLIWVIGSAYYGVDKPSVYECLIEYKGHTKYICGEVKNLTANQIMIEGFKNAVERITKPSDVILISANSLGLHKAFKNSGPNAEEILNIYNKLVLKQCTFSEGRYTNGVNNMKKYIAANAVK